MKKWITELLIFLMTLIMCAINIFVLSILEDKNFITENQAAILWGLSTLLVVFGEAVALDIVDKISK